MAYSPAYSPAFRPLAVSALGPVSIRPLACSPPYVVSLRYDDRNSMPTTFFSFFSKVFYLTRILMSANEIKRPFKKESKMFCSTL